MTPKDVRGKIEKIIYYRTSNISPETVDKIIHEIMSIIESNQPTVNVVSGIDYKGEIVRYEQLEVEIVKKYEHTYKELMELLAVKSHENQFISDPNVLYGNIAKAIIERYSQILKKPVQIRLHENGHKDNKKYYIFTAFKTVFDKESERQQWLDEHYVEVVND